MAVPRVKILLWSTLSGLLWTLAWPAVGGLAPLAFVAWLPLLHAERLHERITTGRRRSFLPYILPALVLWNAACSWWLGAVSEPLVTRLVAGVTPTLVNTLLMSLPWVLKRMVARRHGQWAGSVAFVVFWIAFERLHHGWDLQWPWLSLGNVFAELPAWVQWYSFTGILGGTLWILATNLLLDRLLHGGLALRRRTVWAATVTIVLPLAISLVMYVRYEPRGEALEVVVVQPNMDPYQDKFGGMDPLVQLDRMLEQALAVITDSTRLVLLPETALQETTALDRRDGELIGVGLWENDIAASRSAQRIARFIGEHPQVAVLAGMSSAYLFGADEPSTHTSRPISGTDRRYDAYNAALFMDGDGTVQTYRKSKLVAGVELMPFASVLGRLDDLALDLGGTTGSLGAQEERAVLGGEELRIAPAICYESVFGEHLGAHVANGATLIAIMTNDGWWGDSPGYRQHLAYGRLRAIETRRDIVRSANTGISCTIDQVGNVHHATGWWRAEAFRATVLANDQITWYVRHGDLIGRSAVALAVVLLVWLVFTDLYRRWRKVA